MFTFQSGMKGVEVVFFWFRFLTVAARIVDVPVAAATVPMQAAISGGTIAGMTFHAWQPVMFPLQGIGGLSVVGKGLLVHTYPSEISAPVV